MMSKREEGVPLPGIISLELCQGSYLFLEAATLSPHCPQDRGIQPGIQNLLLYESSLPYTRHHIWWDICVHILFLAKNCVWFLVRIIFPTRSSNKQLYGTVALANFLMGALRRWSSQTPWASASATTPPVFIRTLHHLPHVVCSKAGTAEDWSL